MIRIGAFSQMKITYLIGGNDVSKQVFYHVTCRNNVQSILSKGLTISKGVNKDAIGDERKGICLCKQEDVPYWLILLGLLNNCAIFKVQGLDGRRIKQYKYCAYSEYMYSIKILPQQLELVRIDSVIMQADINFAMQKLCEEYIMTISHLVWQVYKIYDKGKIDRYDGQYLTLSFKALITALPHIDYKHCNKIWVCNYVRECSDYGEIVITDIEENGTRRLYEILMDYPKDKWYEYRKWLYCYIRQELMFLFV